MASVYTPFDVTDRQLKKSAFKDRAGFCRWVCQELDLALSARSGDERDIKYAWALYQQDRTRRRLPWPGAADLTSPYAAEYVDALHARLMTIIFTEPVWTIEGFGPSAVKAPYVESFHQRAQEEERFQTYADELILRALVEGSGVVEISECVDYRRETQRKQVKLRLDAAGQPVLDDGEPELEQVDGRYVEAEKDDPAAEVEIDSLEPVRVGPSYDVVPALDFLTLPGHARDRTQVWGYAKRLYRRVPELTAKTRLGVYDKTAVEALGTDDERQGAVGDVAPSQATVASQEGPTAQKELWDVQVLADCDGRGERWYRVTVSKDRLQLLRLKKDDRTTRYAQFTPFPKPGSVGRGYSLISHKMRTVIEEDTALRNLRADVAAFKAAQPILRTQNALWDPTEQPIGPGRVLDVRDPNEIKMLQGVQDVPNSINQWKADVRTDGDRLLGTNDTALGQDTQETKTLGEVQLRAGYSEVRMNVILKRLSEALEEVWLARHTIWKRVLQEREGQPPTRAMVVGVMADGMVIDGVGESGEVSAALLEGTYWAKPKGSVETADLNRQRQDFNQLLATLPALAQMNPTIAAIFATVPAAKSLVKTMLKVNRVQDVQSFVGPEQKSVFDAMQQQQEMTQLAQDPRMQILQQLMGARDGAAPPVEAGAPMGAGDPNAAPVM